MSTTKTLSAVRRAEVTNIWRHRKGAWQAPFETILNDVMVHAFYNDDDYDEVRQYLIDHFGPKENQP